MREVERNIKKKYYRPEIISVKIDVSLVETEAPSEAEPQPPEEPFTGVSSYDGNESKYVFPDSPASDNPFGGSTPNYR